MAAPPQKPAEKRSVLIVDDDQDDRQKVVRYLEEGFVVREAATFQETEHELSNGLSQCIVIAIDLEFGPVGEFMPGIVERGLPAVLYANRRDEATMAMADCLGGSELLVKSHLSREMLTRAIDRAICRCAIRRIVDQSLSYRLSQPALPGHKRNDDPLDAIIVGEYNTYGQHARVARSLFLEIVEEIARGITKGLDGDAYSKSRILGVGLGELGVASSEVFALLKEALAYGLERLGEPEARHYAESCQVAALEVMAHLADHYNERNRAPTATISSLN